MAIKYISQRHRPFNLRVEDMMRTFNLKRVDIAQALAEGKSLSLPVVDLQHAEDLITDLYTMLLHCNPSMINFRVWNLDYPISAVTEGTSALLARDEGIPKREQDLINKGNEHD